MIDIDDDVRPTLTARQLDVLRLAREGYTNGQIATALGISHNTVKRHLTWAFQTLNTHDRTRAVIKAINLGLISLWDDDMPTRKGVISIRGEQFPMTVGTVGGRAGTAIATLRESAPTRHNYN